MFHAAVLFAFIGFSVPDAEFAREVVAEYPALAIESTTDYERVVMLRQWAWSHTDYAISPEASHAFENPEWQKADAPEYYHRFARNEGGVICGGTGLGLQKLYLYFGFRAWRLSSQCGIKPADRPHAPGHVTTLVEILHRGRRIVVLQDASYNVDFHDAKTGEPIEYLDLLGRLRRRAIETIRSVEPKTLPWPRVVVPARFRKNMTDAECVEFSQAVDQSMVKCETLADGTLVIRSPRTWSHFTTDPRSEAWKLDLLKANGYPRSMLFLHRFQRGISGPDGQAMLAKARAVAGKALVP